MKPKYLHSSVFGSSYEDCLILETAGDTVKILFFDPIAEKLDERWTAKRNVEFRDD